MSLDAKLKQSLLETAARHRLRRGKSGRQMARNLVDLACTLKKRICLNMTDPKSVKNVLAS